MQIDQKDKQLLKDFLDSHRLMSVATKGDHLWIATVYYIADEDLNLFFISPGDSEHSKHIEANNEVACAIADHSQKASDPKVGLQLHGVATQEKGIDRIKWMLSMYNKLHPSTAEKLNFRNFESKVMTSQVYKVTPKKIKFFNQELFGNEEEKIFIIE